MSRYKPSGFVHNPATGVGPQGRPPKLELCTLSDGSIRGACFPERPLCPHYEVRVRDFGNGAAELVAFRGDLTPRPGRKADPDFVRERKETRFQMDVIDRERSQSRARKVIRHRVMMLRADRLLTLTYRENKLELAKCWSDVQRFTRLMRKSFPDFQYVIVPERQQRGAWHFHLAIKGFRPVNVVRFYWRKAICGDGKGDVGNIQITAPRTGADWQRAKLAAYLSKYISKDFDSDQIYARRFSSSQTIPEPIDTRFYVPIGDASFYVMTLLIKEFSPRGMTRCFESSGSSPVIWMASY